MLASGILQVFPNLNDSVIHESILPGWRWYLPYITILQWMEVFQSLVHQWHEGQLFSLSMQQLRKEQGVGAADFSHRCASAIAEQFLILSVDDIFKIWVASNLVCWFNLLLQNKKWQHEWLLDTSVNVWYQAKWRYVWVFFPLNILTFPWLALSKLRPESLLRQQETPQISSELSEDINGARATGEHHYLLTIL